jgi:two-component system sensor histidine kinase SenX3
LIVSGLAWGTVIGIVVGVLVALPAGILLGRADRGARAPRTAAEVGASAPDFGPESGQSELAGRIIDVLEHGVVVVDRDEQVISANPAAEAMGVTAGDRLMVPELASLVRTTTDTGVAAHCELDLSALAATRNGRGPDALSVQAVPLIDTARSGRSRVAAIVLLLDDVTEQHRLDAVRRDFVANVSHELKTPVGALTLLAEAIQEAADDPEVVQRFAGRMQHEGARLGRLVRELIELSRLQGAEPLPGSGPVDVDRIIHEAADRTRLAAERADIRVRLTCAANLQVGGNESQLAMAVANLIDNAVAYSPAGTRVAVNARAVDDPSGSMVEISVSDQGIGLAEADLVRVFERFYRVDPARSRETGGTGLGLAIVKHVATNHGGSINVWSSEGAGSTFTIRLPRVHSGTRSSQLELTTKGTV